MAWSGDFKEKRMVHRFPWNFKALDLCEWCDCSERPGSKSSPFDFRWNAPWMKNRVSQSDYLLAIESYPGRLSPFSKLRQWDISRNRIDLLHSFWKGSAQDMIGAALFEVSNRRAEATGLTQDDVLYDLYIECKAWQKKSGKYWKMPGAFSRKLLQVKYAYDYPHLADAVKAGSVRMLFKWLIMKLTTLVEADPADHDPSEHAKTRGALFWNIGQAILIYERAPVILTRAQADGAFDHGIRGLQLYQELANKSLAAKSCVWKVRPKTHALAELFLQTAETCENPYYLDCFDFESFLRIVKNVVTKTHASTASYSTIERYLLLLTIRTLNRSPLVT